MIVPFPAGGGVDVIARPFAEMFGALLQQPIVVMPRDGAAGTIGMGVVAAAKPDGYTLAFTPNGPVTVQPHVIPTLAYKMDSLQPLCQIFAVQYVLAVRGQPVQVARRIATAQRRNPASCRTASAASPPRRTWRSANSRTFPISPPLEAPEYSHKIRA
ncbi:MAG: hypothetical protein IPI73_25390 [Betaproteobacteria bacterium]|nr:hypothetical protein [Betaproteobacteria bacterium]